MQCKMFFFGSATRPISIVHGFHLTAMEDETSKLRVYYRSDLEFMECIS
ncbi:hypothetical protein M6B38_345915 [Iris pallida]|uniref:Uncharacterized protein n=1 Tax=Iris pallida TaxID=29817 RepID=A0AAX6GUE3_IRIPA|nr:hypothetical protein M6B38_345915 [Iris pallida]